MTTLEYPPVTWRSLIPIEAEVTYQPYRGSYLAWASGPWDSEPDRVSWIDPLTNRPCLITRHPDFGFLCGYVAVDPQHHLWGMSWRDIYGLYAHGGVNYSDKCAESDDITAVCHAPKPGMPEDVWWFGFDCAHAFDLIPASAAILAKFDHGTPEWMQDVYRNIIYVINEVQQLAKQLAT